ncbi:T9SS type B sorting domain-containing protein [Flexibacter flexilis]|nr:gliding motility-associated C-terminal domain-containing protein [Flexibacter flexilis]
MMLKTKLLLGVVVFLFLINGLAAQNLACFYFKGASQNMDTVTVCIGQSLSLDDCFDTTQVTDINISYNIHYNLQPTDFVSVDRRNPYTFSYSTAGTYTVVQDINKGTAQQRKKIVVVILPPAPEYTLQGCNNNVLSVHLDGQRYKRYYLNFGDASAPKIINFKGADTTILYTYASPNTYTVAVRGMIPPSDCGVEIQQQMTVFQSLIKPEVMSMTATKAAGLTVRFDARPFLQYRFLVKKQNASVYTFADTISSASGIITANVPNTSDATTVPYCLMVQAFDVCGNILNSTEMCNSPLDVQSLSGQNIIEWPTYTPNAALQSYELFRDGQNVGTFNSALTNQYTDTNIKCGKQYCYSLRTTLTHKNGLNNDNITISTEGNKCVTAFFNTKPAALTHVTASVSEDNKILVSWQKPSISIAQYNIVQHDGDNSTTFLVAANDTSKQMPNVIAADKKYCYTISYTDSCGNVSDESASICPVYLSAFEQKGQKMLQWSAYAGTPAATGYRLEWLDENGQVVSLQDFNPSTNSFQDNTLDTLHQLLRYRVRVLLPDSTPVYSNIGTLKQRLKIWIPEAFSPNQDGTNDAFRVYGYFAEKVDLQIFNQWGQLVFRADNFRDAWDGTSNGTDVTAGVYVLRMDITDQTGHKETFRQTLTVAR